MDFDLQSFTDGLRESIHGAPPPAPASFTAWRASVGLPAPFQVVAIQFGEGAPPRLPATHPPAALLRVHPGLAYLCCPSLHAFRSTLAPRHLLVGESQRVADEHALVVSIQNALLSLRRRELAAVRRRRGEAPGFGAEVEARAVALDHLRSDRPWGEALTVWTEIVLCRHSASLHTIRRKMVELVGLLTRDTDRGHDVARAVRLAIAAIYDTYALTSLAAAFSTAVHQIILATVEHPTHEPKDPLIRRALVIMHAQHTGPLSLRLIARQLDVTPAHLSRRFTATMGTTLTTHLTSLRLATACDRLTDSDDGILPIALASGFGSLEHFHRTFRHHLGTTPRSWRIAHQDE